ncbi:MAG: Ig-like domain-containing protein [Pacificimonas sp.]|jgi:hypothetical protein|nr:Ig-like domain-containing protein [Pacificimonas sp.]
MGFQPTAFEQLQLELINRFRLDPAGEYDRLVINGQGTTAEVQAAIAFFGVDIAVLESQLSTLTPVAPFAWNTALADAADFHSGIMIQQDIQTHQAPGEPSAAERILDAGYNNARALGENVYAFTDDPLQGHAGFIIDWGFDDVDDPKGDFRATGDGIQDPPGHRITLINSTLTEIGIGAIAETDPSTQVGPWVVTQNFGLRSDYQAQIVGVIAADDDEDGFYDLGEGLGGVTVTLTDQDSGAVFSTMSWESGGYQAVVPAGTYAVAIAGPGVAVPTQSIATIGDANVKVDFYLGAPPPPLIAAADAATTDEDNAVVIDALSNDSGGLGALSVSAVGAAENGQVVLGADGTITYTPAANFNGDDSFTYSLADDNGTLSEGTVSITVIAVNDNPSAADVGAEGIEDTVLTARPVLADIDGDPVSIKSVGQLAGGTLSIIEGGTALRFQPDADFVGTTSGLFTVSDGAGGQATATATFTLQAVNDAPVAEADNVTTAEDTPLVFDPLANDRDPDGDALTLVSITETALGTLAIVEGGRLSFIPNANAFGATTAIYEVADASGLVASAAIAIEITPVNDAPETPDLSATGAPDEEILIPVEAFDVDSPEITLQSVGAPASGTASFAPGDITIAYTPDRGFRGTDTFSYTVVDSEGLASTGVVTVTVVGENVGPVAVDDAVTSDEDTQLRIDVLANDSDPDGDALTLESVETPSGAGFTAVEDGRILFAPFTNFNGTAVFGYTVADAAGVTASAQVVVTVNPVNDAPEGTSLSVETNFDNAVTFTPSGTDIDGDTVTVIAAADGENGAAVLNVDGTVTYTPNEGFAGTDRFLFTVTDPSGAVGAGVVTVEVKEVGAPPVFAPAGSRLVVGRDETAGIGGATFEIIGTRGGSEWVRIGAAGEYSFDASFNAGGDRIYLDRAFSDLTTQLDGSRMVLFADDGFKAAIPLGPQPITLVFSDTIQTLRFDTQAGQPVFEGDIAIIDPLPAVPTGDPPTIPGSGGSRLNLGAGESVDIGPGFLQVAGRGLTGETVAIGEGTTARFDASFNRGGDTLVLGGDRTSFEIVLLGSTATIYDNATTAIALPIGAAVPTLLQFDDGLYEILFDLASGELSVTLREEAPPAAAFAAANGAIDIPLSPAPSLALEPAEFLF